MKEKNRHELFIHTSNKTLRIPHSSRPTNDTVLTNRPLLIFLIVLGKIVKRFARSQRVYVDTGLCRKVRNTQLTPLLLLYPHFRSDISNVFVVVLDGPWFPNGTLQEVWTGSDLVGESTVIYDNCIIMID